MVVKNVFICYLNLHRMIFYIVCLIFPIHRRFFRMEMEDFFFLSSEEVFSFARKFLIKIGGDDQSGDLKSSDSLERIDLNCDIMLLG